MAVFSYEKVDMKVLYDTLKANAMRTKSVYLNKHVELVGEIAGFDSDGEYNFFRAIGTENQGTDIIMCYIEDDAYRQFLMEKFVGDIVTVKGQVISVSEVTGYAMILEQIS